jgi:hypothetical protein
MTRYFTQAANGKAADRARQCGGWRYDNNRLRCQCRVERREPRLLRTCRSRSRPGNSRLQRDPIRYQQAHPARRPVSVCPGLGFVDEVLLTCGKISIRHCTNSLSDWAARSWIRQSALHHQSWRRQAFLTAAIACSYGQRRLLPPLSGQAAELVVRPGTRGDRYRCGAEAACAPPWQSRSTGSRPHHIRCLPKEIHGLQSASVDASSVYAGKDRPRRRHSSRYRCFRW